MKLDAAWPALSLFLLVTASGTVLPFPFELPDASKQHSGTAVASLPEPKTPASFKRRCFRFVYAAVHEVKKDAARLPELLAALCKDSNTAHCQQWAMKLQTVVERKEDKHRHRGAGERVFVTPEDSYGAWCDEVAKPIEEKAEQQTTPMPTKSRTIAAKVTNKTVAKPSKQSPSAQVVAQHLKEKRPVVRAAPTAPTLKPAAKTIPGTSKAQAQQALRGTVSRPPTGVASKVAVSHAAAPESVSATRNKKDAHFKIGEEVTVNGRHAVVSRGPDGDGEYKVKYDGGAESTYLKKEDIKSTAKILAVKILEPTVPQAKALAVKAASGDVATTHTGAKLAKASDLDKKAGKAKKCACFQRDGKQVCHCTGDAH